MHNSDHQSPDEVEPDYLTDKVFRLIPSPSIDLQKLREWKSQFESFLAEAEQELTGIVLQLRQTHPETDGSADGLSAVSIPLPLAAAVTTGHERPGSDARDEAGSDRLSSLRRRLRELMNESGDAGEDREALDLDPWTAGHAGDLVAGQFHRYGTESH